METRFNFDKQLWQRFVTIAQPYFYPGGKGSGWIFFGLLVAATIFVITLMFFVEIGVTFAGQALFPEFFTKLAAGLVEQTQNNLKFPTPYIAFAGLLGGSLAFVAAKQQLQGRWLQWGLLGVLLFLSLTVNRLNVMISFVFRFIDTALQERSEPVFWQFLIIYGVVIVAAIPILVVYRYLRLKLALFWREWLTNYFLNLYFSQRAYYELDSNAANTAIDNPDQRITQDVSAFTGTTLSFLLNVLDSVLTLYAFSGILYGISKPLTVGLLVYATVGTAIAVILGRKFIGINFNQLRLEANFRYGMVHVRDNAESIAFYQGEAQEQRHVVSRFVLALRNYNFLILWQAFIDIFQYGYNYFTRIVPYVIVAPLYFAKQTDFGTITQATIAFSQVLGSLSIVANQIDDLAGFAAGINRLGAFYDVLKDPERPHTSEIQTQVDPRLTLQNLSLLTPNSEQTLVRDLSLVTESQQRLLVVGPSGCGKSSLLRAIAGLWNNGTGSITRPDIRQMLFLPQKPYMLLGTLRDQLLYPNLQKEVPDGQLLTILEQVNLEHLPERVGGLDAEQDWSNLLSLGEQQRLAFARILLSEPGYAILDEATSALDIANERLLYERLRQMNTTYLSVGHRTSLLAYHDIVLQLDGSGGWEILSISEYSQRLAAA